MGLPIHLRVTRPALLRATLAPNGLAQAWPLLLVLLSLTIYANLALVADLLLAPLPLARGTAAGEAAWYFVYALPKALLLLAALTFVAGALRGPTLAERGRDLLARRAPGIGHLLGACFALAIPVPAGAAPRLVIDHAAAGVSPGITLSLLVAAPLLNEVTIALLLALAGWQVTALALGGGLLLATLAGLLLDLAGARRWGLDPTLGRLRPPPPVEDWPIAWSGRLRLGRAAVAERLGQIWPWVVLGIATAAVLQGWLPEAVAAGTASQGALPLALLAGLPLAGNAAGLVPLAAALLGKGAALGAGLAFLLAGLLIPLPDLVRLRRVLRPGLLVALATILVLGILGLGIVVGRLA